MKYILFDLALECMFRINSLHKICHRAPPLKVAAVLSHRRHYQKAAPGVKYQYDRCLSAADHTASV